MGFVEQTIDSESMLWGAFNSLSEHVAIVDGDGTIRAANRSLESYRRDHGLGEGDVRGHRFDHTFLQPLGVAIEAAERIVAGLDAVLKRLVPRFECEYHVRSALRLEWFSLSVTPTEGLHDGAIVLQRDITLQKSLEFDLIDRANHDPLTGLANRRFFLLEGEFMLALARRQGWPATLVFLDLDGFKTINDEYGHEAGDVVLKRVATRLVARTRTSDLVARMGGDEFALLLGNVSPAESLHLVQQYRRSLARPPMIAGSSVTVRGAFGLAHHPEDGSSLMELLAHADKAMYLDKKRSRTRRRSQGADESGASASIGS